MGVLWHSEAPQTAHPAKGPNVPKPKKHRRVKIVVWLSLLALFAVLALLGSHEINTSNLQSREFSRYASTLDYALGDGPSHAIDFPSAGPFDKRLGYANLPQMLERLTQRDYRVTQQVQFSPALLNYTHRGYFPPYPEKLQSGLDITDCRGEPLYRFTYPQQLYRHFADIPPLMVSSLLFIEDRHLLDTDQPLANPAVDWPRFLKAAISQVGKRVAIQDQSAGGSTLATQLEKYRHSPNGLTLEPMEKLRQMISASIRAYQKGPQTLEARQDIVRDYLNSVPLSAAPGHGEVHGLADGLRVWYGADFAQVNRLLNDDRSPLAERALALRQSLSLMIAQRRPSYYLGQGHEELEKLTDSHLRLLANGGVIDPPLRDAALAQRVPLAPTPSVQPIPSNKAINAARNRLSAMLGQPLYDLDRLDLEASSTINAQLQEQVSQYLANLAKPDFAEQIGLFGERLLSPQKTRDVRYSFTLFERTAEGARVRVQTDNTDQPFDINEGSKLELGSTAKLRVLTTYLQIIAELHDKYAPLSASELRKVEIADQDPLSRWARDYLLGVNDRGLSPMLDAALERRYSASPDERFFTGGGLHHFGNFRREDNGRIPTLHEALRESINLPFIRLMRDLVRYSTYHGESNSAELLKDDRHPLRADYLKRFADREGTTFLLRFWRKYQSKSANERLDTFLDGLRHTSTRLAAVHRYLLPNASEADFASFLKARLPQEKLDDKRLDKLYRDYGPGAWSLPDQGYIARVHPLELWLLGYLINNPDATFKDAVTASTDQRQEVYGWLFKTRHKSARDSRIRSMLEVEAFLDIHQRWQRLGYPFDHLVPSLATAIGSSGDRPAALAELIGIIQNDGVREAVVRLDELHFAANTPYETHVRQNVHNGQRVMPAEVAAAMRKALGEVVESGTARRLRATFALPDGTPLAIGGKTGTGDNRFQSVTRGGHVISSRAINRTATFVFYLGPNHYGTLTAFVPGEAAENFRFTSALPVQVFKGMAPILQPYLQGGIQTGCALPSAMQAQMW
ncbi:transglycosylase domain-containing protein [Pseudomonas sp. LRF_L74]|uniref:transglycosylase domain-containing protein n=1 Tax=Pseudomonas sp. LRF_L74 TaxID=3369422 RepID=UPI003F625B3A